MPELVVRENTGGIYTGGGVKQDYNHVDACTMWFVKQPEYYDVIVTENLFSDIITDLAAIMASASPLAATSTPLGRCQTPPLSRRSIEDPLHRHHPSATTSSVK